ncbi:MAG: cytochrome C [Denitrovibrio sp.]|nr:MAG: cytochrome C [Denitrovibrio sp.]
MKKITTLIMILAISLISVVAFASTHDGGRQVWKKNCRVACHDGKTPGSPVLSPDSKTQYQWKNSFANNRNYILKFHTKGEVDKINSKQWEAIYDFVSHHAHDSNNPEDCMGATGALVN